MFSLSSTVYLDRYEKEYFRILSVNKPPPGPLANRITRIKPNRLSQFEPHNNQTCCIYALKHDVNNDHCKKHKTLMTEDDIDELCEFLVSNDYSINNSFTKIIQKNPRLNRDDGFICYVSYK